MVGDNDDDVEGVVASKGAGDGFVFSGRSFPLKGSLTGDKPGGQLLEHDLLHAAWGLSVCVFA